MIRAAAKSHEDVLRRGRPRSDYDERGRRPGRIRREADLAAGASSPRRPSSTRAPTTRRSPATSPARRATKARPHAGELVSSLTPHPDAPLRREPGPAGGLLRARRDRPGSRRSSSTTARSSRTTTSSTSMGRCSPSLPSCPSPGAAVCIIKHTTPCGIGVGDVGRRSVHQGARDRPGERLRLGHRREPEAVDEAKPPRRCPSSSSSASSLPASRPVPWRSSRRRRTSALLTFPEGTETSWSRVAEQSCQRRSYGTVFPMPRLLAARSTEGMLAQTPARAAVLRGCRTRAGRSPPSRQPTEREWDDLRFAWAAIFGVKSNAILLARGGRARHRGGADEPGGLVEDRGAEGGRGRARSARLRACVGCLLPLPGRRRRRRRGGREGRRPAGRIDPGRRGCRRRPTSTASPWSSPAGGCSGTRRRTAAGGGRCGGSPIGPTPRWTSSEQRVEHSVFFDACQESIDVVQE